MGTQFTPNDGLFDELYLESAHAHSTACCTEVTVCIAGQRHAFQVTEESESEKHSRHGVPFPFPFLFPPLSTQLRLQAWILIRGVSCFFCLRCDNRAVIYAKSTWETHAVFAHVELASVGSLPNVRCLERLSVGKLASLISSAFDVVCCVMIYEGVLLEVANGSTMGLS